MIQSHAGNPLRRLTVALSVSAAIGLGGCVSLLPKSPPAQLYRFGDSVQSQAASTAGQRDSVALAPLDFAPGASGDRILTMTGSEAAYIAAARWVTPAEDLFQAALERSFSGSAVRLSERREALAATFLLQIKVENFEVRYGGAQGAPNAYVSLRAKLIRASDRVVVSEHRFEASAAAADNRVGAIVPAIDEATAKVLTDLVAWTSQTATGG